MSQLVHIRLEKSLQNDIKDLIAKDKYSTQSEFIKEAIRHRLSEVYKEEAMREIAKMKGSVKARAVTKEGRKNAVEEYLNSSRNVLKEYDLE